MNAIADMILNDWNADKYEPGNEDGIALGDKVAGKGKLVWRDEFNGINLDLTKWNYDYGPGTQYGSDMSGWGNNEKQWYKQENISVAGGRLIIEARHDNSDPAYPYSSGKITTAGTLSYPGSLGSFPPKAFVGVPTGYVEARIKAPRGKGFWPAFWLLGADFNGYSNYAPVLGWPACGEIDIFEMKGGQETSLYQSIHYGTSYPLQKWEAGSNYAVKNMAAGYHVYGVEWNSTALKFYYDNTLKNTINFPLPGGAAANSQVFYNNVPFAIIIDLAVGGNFINLDLPPEPVFSAPVEDRCLMVDWVRVYEN